MNELQPKAAFQHNEDAMRTWRAVVDNPVFNQGMMIAMADYCLNGKPTADELNGARTFIRILLNLAEIEQPLSQLPIRRATLRPDTRGVKADTQRAD